MRRWELVSGNSAKFWEIDRDGSDVTVRFGRLDTNGQTQTKTLASAEAAEAHVAKLVAEKEKKGYLPVTTTAPPVTAPASRPAGSNPAGTTAPAPAAAAQPTGGTVAQTAATTSPASAATKPLPADEDTWVLPKAFQRDVVRRRGFEPAPVFTVDTELAETSRRRIGKQTATTIERVLSEPASHPELVAAARTHLAGRPDPVGAAALAAITRCGLESLHAWIADHGLAFATEATVAFMQLLSAPEYRAHAQTNENLRTRSNYFHINIDKGEGKMLVTLRSALAVAGDTELRAVEAAMEKPVVLAGETESTAKHVRTFLLPGNSAWLAQACQARNSYTSWWLLPCSATTAEDFRTHQLSVTGSSFILNSAVSVLGTAIAPLLAEVLDSSLLADRRKQALKVLAALPTDEAFTILLDRVDGKYVRPALLSAMAAFPRRAARLLGARSSDPEFRQLLSVHLKTYPELETPEGFVDVESALVPEAPPEALPPVLASPPWLRRKSAAKPVVLEGLPVPPPSLVWAPGEREKWLELTPRYVRDHMAWQQLLKEFKAKRIASYLVRDLVALAPEEELLPLFPDWQPKLGYNSESVGKLLAARFGFAAMAPLVRIVESSSADALVVLPFATPEVAALMADWLVRLKQVRKIALEWLSRHRDTAARLLIPQALGKPGAARRNAEAALRQLHGMGVDVVALAPTPEAAAALEAFLAIDPVDILPARVPVLGEWADTRLLPQVLLADRRQALSTEAARNLLMTAALSKPDEAYAGLPIAVEACDRTSLAEFAWALFRRWQEMGAPSKESWAFTALGWFGDDDTVRRLAPLIRAWPGESQHTRAVAGLDVLATIGTEVALAHLNGIAEKVKFKGLKAKAQEKVSQIAAELGLSRDQLADRLVPRFGLDEEASLVVDYGARRFTVGFDEQLKPFVLDEDGKRRKDLPKPGAKDDQDKAPLEHKRFAALKKDVRTIASDQILRLERAMVNQRTWTAEEFHTVLAGHPLLWHIVRRLVWVTSDGQSFRLAEDRTLADAHDDEYTLPADATVRVAHPADLAGALEAWGEVFADYEILQPFPQLGRPLHVLAAGDVLPQLKKYCDVAYPVGRILGLTKKGWVRGEPQDAGVECWITRPLPSGGALVAALDPGIAVGAVDFFPDVKFTEVWYSPTGEGYWSSERSGSAAFEPDPITLSELLTELESLSA
ncbi:WGR domain-containing protein [Lentzea fradiae]|uniref:WGR domain-containing protein n=1 Tax=Lentzea fradiae TaxID=200378 RepID=A0A1G7KBA6_9PSEU|nr:DUF4132 domain-containing protein [Lentzea fradiae]SDF34447.1 WGR domain-containing protein [Lentzea fradiae]